MKNLENIRYSSIKNYSYEQFFHEVQYNGKTLNDAERKELLKVSDETIAYFSEGLPKIKDILDSIKDKNDEFHETQRVIVSAMRFVLITMLDSMVLSKYFILADKDYDRRVMRGKLMVILNEGFKKLYGFNEKAQKNSEWNKLSAILKYFPEEIQQHYQDLSSLLKKHSESSSWWKDERDIETHLDTEKLYDDRCKKIEESKVVMEYMKLFDTLFAVDLFLTNMHTCINNTLYEMYLNGQLKEE